MFLQIKLIRLLFIIIISPGVLYISLKREFIVTIYVNYCTIYVYMCE